MRNEKGTQIHYFRSKFSSLANKTPITPAKKKTNELKFGLKKSPSKKRRTTQLGSALGEKKKKTQ